MERTLLRLLTPALAASLLLLALAQTASASHARGGNLLPDFTTKEPERFSISTSGGVRRLRFDNEVGNAHTGPAELIGGGADADCDGNGVTEGGERVAYHRVYRDSDGNGVFSRTSEGTNYTDNQIGCLAWHPEHGHTHFQNFASYLLKRESDGVVVSSSEKVTFCLMDTRRYAGSILGSPSSAFYRECGLLRQGISVGWSDEYYYGLSGQNIVINPGGQYVGNGYYCVVSTADPGSLFTEDNAAGSAELNNAASLRIRLRNGGRSVTTYRGTSCGGVGPGLWGRGT